MNVRSLAEMFAKEGAPQEARAHLPFWSGGAETAWWVQRGHVDLFLVPSHAEAAPGARVHLLRLAEGHALFSCAGVAPGEERGFLVVGTNETRLLRLPLGRLRQAAADSGLAPLLADELAAWMEALYRGLADGLPPADCVKLAADEELDLSEGGAAYVADGVLWARQVSGQSCLADLPGLLIKPGMIVPLSPAVWLRAVSPITLASRQTLPLLTDGSLWPALAQFEARIRQWAALKLNADRAAEAGRIQARQQFQQSALTRAVSQLAEPLAPARALAPSIELNDPLSSAFHLVTDALGVPWLSLPDSRRGKTQRDPVDYLAKAARLRVRRIMLRGDWWLGDNGPMLAFRRETKRPVAILPVSATRYVVVDPAERTREPLTAETAQRLDWMAYTFHRPFPDTALNILEVFRFGLQNVRGDLMMVGLMSLAAGFLGMAVPLGLGLLFDTVIPSSATSQLWFLVLALAATGFATIVFELTRGIALLRAEAKSDASIEAAIWDRLLSLPLPFFRDFSAGDLSLRANGINAIRQIVSGAVITSMLSGFFSLFNFFLLFYFSVRLAAVATVLVLVNVGVTLLVSIIQLRIQRPLFEAQGKISGLVLQLITGIAKLRVAASELNAYAVWAKAFARQKKTDLELMTLGNRMTVFNEAYPLLTSICLFAVVAYWNQPGISTGAFLAFTAAFMTFLYAGLEASDALLSILQTVPIYERALPILRARPEVNPLKTDPGELTGRIELSHVSFRYKADGPLVLHDLSMSIEPGDFVAVVGPSGSGKSTLMRLLLGFDRPETGGIRFDGLDLDGVDIQAVRRQIGVVLQHGKLMPGDIFENIVGSALFTLDQAWEAARDAGLAEDLEQMPMGMHTVLGEGGGTLSGGQRQRLMIARAIVGKPRIILFDEATSALDNRTQAIVNHSLERLKATRIVVAHRLSTIMNANRIFVVQSGRIVQTGSYQTLLEQPGLFAELARRQIA